MKKFAFLIFMIFTSNMVSASHVMGGELRKRQTGPQRVRDTETETETQRDTHTETETE